jgi:hypothetical protein
MKIVIVVNPVVTVKGCISEDCHCSEDCCYREGMY